MLSFENIYTETQEQCQDSDATSLVTIKRAINTGAKKFGAVLNREWRNTNKTFSLVANQQYYQMPEDCIRPKSIVVTIGSVRYPLTEIESEDDWNRLNMRTSTSSVPSGYYVRGSDEFGIFPIPLASVDDAGSINYERRMRDMSQADHTAGTITVTVDSATVTGVGTNWTALMVGRSLKVNDAYGDGMWYKIAGFTSDTEITLENTYSGATAAGLSYAIGEIPDIPEEFHEALIDYSSYRYYMRRKDASMASNFKSLYDEALRECKAQYSSKTTSQYTRAIRVRRGYVHYQPTQGIV
jgi:hypothetical protein